MKKNLGKLLLVCVLAMLTAAALFAGCGQKTPEEIPQDNWLVAWNIERLNYTGQGPTFETGRILRSDGYYHMKFAVEGEQLDFLTDDLRLASNLDGLDVALLKVDDQGVIEEYKNPYTEGRVAVDRCYVQEVNGSSVKLNTSGSYIAMEMDFAVPETAVVYNVGASGPLCGVKGSVQVDDVLTAITNEKGEVTHIFVQPYKEPGDVYWNITRMYNSTTGTTTRPSDLVGNYVFEVCLNGEVVTVKTRDAEIATLMDKQAARCWGLSFDEEGYVNGVLSTASVTGGGPVASWFTVMEVREDGSFIAEKLSAGASDFGQVEDLKPGPYCKIINTTNVGKRGEYTTLRPGDQIHCLKDARNRVCYIFVISRIAGGNIYWNVDRKYDSKTQQSTRTMDSDGYYRILLATNGEQVTLKVKDKAVLNQMEANGARCFTLDVTEDGEITAYYGSSRVTGGGVTASWYDVIDIAEDGTITAERTIGGDEQGKVVSFKLAEDAQVINGSAGYVNHCGEFTEVKVGDRVHGLTNYKKEVQFLFVVVRPVDVPLYWNVERKYNSTTKQTTRERAADGYYYIEMTSGGKEVTVKTSDRELVNKIDSQAARCMGLRVSSSGIVTKYYPTGEVKNCNGGVEVSWCYVTKVNGNRITALRTYSGADQGKQYHFTVGSWTQIYNESSVFEKNRGEKTTLKEGDLIHCLRNKDKDTTVVFVIERSVDGPIYWNIDRKYDSTNKVTTRTPDADGWYYIDMAGGGQRYTFKTQNVEHATKIDSQAARCWGLKVTEDGVIEEVYSAGAVRGATGGVQVSWCHITEVHENYAIAEKMNSGADFGKVYRIDFADDMKVYNVSPYVESHIGEETTLKVGDMVHCFRDLTMKTTTIMVITPGIETTKGYCPVCKEEVNWAPWDTKYHRVNINTHYYLEGDVEIPGLIQISGGHTAIALNGHKLTSQGQALRVMANTTLTIFDSLEDGSDIGGSMVTTGGDAKTEGGLIGLWNATATLNLYSGTLRHASKAEGGVDVLHGGIIAGNGTVNMYGGKITGGHATGDGGNIRIWNSGTNTGGVNLYGGVIEYGTAGNYGGNIGLSQNGWVNIPADSTGVIAGGTAKHGGNIAARTGSSLTIAGGTVTGGKALNAADIGNGGNIAIEKNATGTITGGTIEKGEARRGGQISVFGTAEISGITLAGGKATFDGANIFTYVDGGSAAELTLKDVTVTGADDNIASVSHYGNKLEVSGNVIISGGTVNLKLNSGKCLTVGETGLGENAQMGITISGNASVFAKVSAEADKDAFFPDNSALEVACDSELNLSLRVPGVDMTHDPASHCVCGGNAAGIGGHTCDTDVTWIAWGDSAGEITTLPTASGNYYLVNDVNMTAGVTLSDTTSVVLCLNGHTVSTTNRAYRLNNSAAVTICDHKVDGEYKGQMITHGFDPATFNADTSGAATEGGLFLMWGNESSVTVYGGTLRMVSENGYMAKNGGLIAGGGTVRIYDGTLRDGIARDAGGNLGLYNHTGHGFFHMYGGTVTGGSASVGGNLASRRNITTQLLGGQITNGTASSYAGGVYMPGSYFKELKLGGDIRITGNTSKNVASNLYVTAANLVTLEALGEQASVGITMTVSGLVGSNITADPGSKITSDDAEKVMVYDEDADTLSLVIPAAPHIHCACGGTDALENHTHAASQQWEAWDSTTSLPKSGWYYLTEDVTTSSNISIAENTSLHLCLNGHTVTYTGSSAMIWARGDVDFTNCGTTGSIITKSSNYTSLLYSYEKVTVNLFNVVVDSSQSGLNVVNWTTNGAVFTIAWDDSAVDTDSDKSGSTFNMYGGKIIGRDVTSGNYNGGAVWVMGGSTFNMYGGQITGAKSAGGAAVIADSMATVNLLGGTITGNAGDKGAVRGTVTATNATKIRVSGDVKVTGNTNTAGTAAANLYLVAGQQFTVTDLGANAKVGVTALTNGILASDVTADPGSRIVPDDATASITYDATAKTLTFTAASAETDHIGHCICGTTDTLPGHTHNASVTWEPWDGTTAFTSGSYYYLTEDIDISKLALHSDLKDQNGDGKAEWFEISNKTVNLCLNGHTITSESRVFKIKGGGILNITDHAKADGTYDGTLVGKGLSKALSSAEGNGNNNEGGLFMLWAANTQLNIYGGNFRLHDEPVAQLSKGGIIQSAGTVTIYDGVLENGKAASGGTISLFNNGATLNFYGGIMRGGKATSGGHIYANGASKPPVVNLFGGTITGAETESTGAVYLAHGTLNIQGEVTIADNLKTGTTNLSNVWLLSTITFRMTDGAKANVGINSATKDAKIGSVGVHMDRNGLFCDDPAYSVYRSGTDVQLKEGHWHCVCGGYSTDPNHVHQDIQWTEWTSATALPASGTYYLKNAVNTSATQTVSSSMKLCLNGKTATCSGRAYWFKGNTDLVDCGKTGAIVRTGAVGNGSVAYLHRDTQDVVVNIYGGTYDAINTTASGSEGGVFAIDASNKGIGTMNLYNGTLDGCAMKTGGSVVLWNGGKLNMYGGLITGGSATNEGGNIQIAGTSQVHIYKGTVSGGRGNEGGNICVGPYAQLTLDDALVEGGTAVSCGGNIMVFCKLFVNDGAVIRNGVVTGNNGGGNIGSFGNSTDICINGGTVTGGKASKGANIILRTNDSKTIKFTMVGGTVEGVHPDVKGVAQSVRADHKNLVLTLGGNAKIDELYLRTGIKITESAEKPLTEAASVGISTESDGEFMIASGAIDYLKVFEAVKSDKAVTKDGTSLEIG